MHSFLNYEKIRVKKDELGYEKHGCFFIVQAMKDDARFAFLKDV